MKKRLLSVFLAITLCLGLAVPAFAAEADFVIEDGVLTRYNGPGGDVTIPRTVKKIGIWSFLERDDITSITIPNTVTEIDINAFRDCGGLTSISIPASVTQIGGHLTHWCPNLAEIKVDSSNPNYTARDGVLFSKDMNRLIECPPGKAGTYSVPYGVTEISSMAFTECALSNLTLSASVSKIDALAFYNCPNLKSVSLPNSLTTIEYGAFSACEKLTTLTIPASVTEIGQFPVQSCFALTSIEVDSENSDYTSIDGVLYTKDLKCLVAYPPGKSGALDIPDGVVEIIPSAVRRCPLLTSVTIPNSVTLIDNSAFDWCTGLTSVTIADGVTTIEAGAFTATGLTEITIPSSVTSIENNPFSGSKMTSIIVDPNNRFFTSIDGILYSKDTKTLLSVPGGRAKSWTIPDHVTTIGKYAFTEPLYGDEHVLTSITIPNSVTKLEKGAFYNCGAMTQITLPDSITSIDSYAFDRCNNLTDVYYSGSKADWEKINIAGSNDPLKHAIIHFSSTGPTPAPSFTDVSPDAWYAAPVAWAVDKGITNGTSPTTFSPGQTCTQLQILTFLYRADRGEGPAAAEDMDLAVEWAKEKGIIGDDFDGSVDCTRSTAVSYIWQALGEQKAAEAASFSDVAADAPYADAVSWAVEKGVTNGDGGEDTFAPDKVCTRGHIVTFLQRAYKG